MANEAIIKKFLDDKKASKKDLNVGSPVTGLLCGSTLNMIKAVIKMYAAAKRFINFSCSFYFIFLESFSFFNTLTNNSILDEYLNAFSKRRILANLINLTILNPVFRILKLGKIDIRSIIAHPVTG